MSGWVENKEKTFKKKKEKTLKTRFDCKMKNFFFASFSFFATVFKKILPDYTLQKYSGKRSDFSF